MMRKTDWKNLLVATGVATSPLLFAGLCLGVSHCSAAQRQAESAAVSVGLKCVGTELETDIVAKLDWENTCVDVLEVCGAEAVAEYDAVMASFADGGAGSSGVSPPGMDAAGDGLAQPPVLSILATARMVQMRRAGDARDAGRDAAFQLRVK